MPWIDEHISAQFFQWEQRGRGWQVWPEPVVPEPPFRQFCFIAPAVPDDGKRPTVFSNLFRSIAGSFSSPPPPPPPPQEIEEPEPDLLSRDQLTELPLLLPVDLDSRRESMDAFLATLSHLREPLAFEMLGHSGHVTTQFVAHPHDASLLRRQLTAYFPEVVCQPQDSQLQEIWFESESDQSLVFELGLEEVFMLPLASSKLDPFIGLLGALSGIQQGEAGLYQILFHPVQHPWGQSMVFAVTSPAGRPFFVNAPEVTAAAERKSKCTLYSVVVRLAANSRSFERSRQILCDMAAALRVFGDPNGNALIPLANDQYPYVEHIQDMFLRQTRRTGMILSDDELHGFVHLPSKDVRSSLLMRQSARTKTAPAVASNGLVLGENTHMGRTVSVCLSPEQRRQHLHVIGISGKGKSTFLFNLIRQDIEKGEGLAVLDPHGDLIDRILGVIPENRIKDVVLIDPADEEYSVGFNILTAHSDVEKNLLASDLVSVFERLSTSWGDQMNSVLRNAILAFLESSRGGTLSDLRRFLIDPDYRNRFLATVGDPDVVYYWRKAFAQLTGNKSIGPVITRLDTFLAPKTIRYIVSQRANRLDFAQIMDGRKIVLAKLSEGLIGKENAFLLGSLLVGKFQQTAMARQNQSESLRKDYWLYIDEFHNLITKSMAAILTGARKYRLGLILAHQELRQMQCEPEVASAVLANAHTRVCFTTSDEDARKLADGFSFFEASDLQKLDRGQAVCRIGRSDQDFNLTVAVPELPDENQLAETQRKVIEASRTTYATPRKDVEDELRRSMGDDDEDDADTGSENEEPPHQKPPPKPKQEQAQPNPPPPQAAPPEKPKPSEAAQVPKPAEVRKEPSEPKPEPAADTVQDAPEFEQRLHEQIKRKIINHAESLHYTVSEEELLSTGGARIDVILRRGNVVIACEVCATTTADHEATKAQKCLKAGFSKIAVIGNTESKLARIHEKVAAVVSPEDLSRLVCCTPAELLSKLTDWATSDPEGGLAEQAKPQKSVFNFQTPGSDSERRDLEKSMLEELTAKLKRPPKPPK